MKFRRLLRTLWRKGWLPCLLALLGVLYALLTADWTPRYVATGKIVIDTFGDYFPKHPGPDYEAINRGTRMQIFESAVVGQRARQRVQGLHPELKEAEVGIKVTIPKGSGIAIVAAIGTEPKYTKVYLDAVLDEAMAVRQEMLEQTPEVIAINRLIDDVLAREKGIKVQAQALAALEKEHHDSLQVVTRERLVGRAFDAKMEVKTQELAGESGDHLKEVREKLTEAEKTLETFDARQSALEKMSYQLTLDLADYQVWKKKLDQLENSLGLPFEGGGVFARPTAAVPYNPLPLDAAIAGALGFGIGLLIALASAFIVTLAATKEPAAA